MINNVHNVVFRCYSDVETSWEAFGINASVYGYGDTLAEARIDISEGLALHFSSDPREIKLNEFHEHCVYPETDSSEAIWVRTYQDLDPDRMCGRREVREAIKTALLEQPEYLNTFRNGAASTGDIIATVCYPDDMLGDLLDQVGDIDRLFVCMPHDRKFFWQCLVTPEADNRDASKETPVSELGLSDAATVWDFMQATNASVGQPESFLLSAA